MKRLLHDLWSDDKGTLTLLVCLHSLLALTNGVGTVMLVPMLDLLEVNLSGDGLLGRLLSPFAAMDFVPRAAAIISAFVVILLARALFGRYAAVKQNELLERYERTLRTRLYAAITNAHWETLRRKPHSDLVSLFTVQCRQARFCLQWVIALFASAVSAALQLGIACCLSLPLTAMVLTAGVGFLILFRPFQRRSKECGKEAVENSRAMYREIQNQLSSIKESRAYAVEEENRRLFEAVSQAYYNISLRTTQLRVIPQLCYSVAAAALIALSFLVGVLMLGVDTARLVILVYIFSRLWPLFSSWQSQLQNIAAYAPAYDTICDTLAALEADQAPKWAPAAPLPFAREVAFSGVTFAYRDAEEPVLENVHFTLPFGSVTALCGRSGTGKSTTADLLLGLLQPSGGVITVDGVALTEENAHQWRQALGYVPQSPLILDDTVRENLRRFHPQATEEEMIQALKDALAWPFVERLEQGLDTVLGTKGVRLSGGEQQRIVLARVLMGNPRLVILDEATSALDYESEAMIRETIHGLRGKTTVLIIAHRLATIRSADRAIVLEGRHVAESGGLKELLEREGGYLAGMVSIE